MTGINERQAPRCFADGVGMVSKDELPYWLANTKPAGLFDRLSNWMASPTGLTPFPADRRARPSFLVGSVSRAA